MAFAIFALVLWPPVGHGHSMAVQRRWGRGTKLTLALFLLALDGGHGVLPSYASGGSTAIVALVICALARAGAGRHLGRPASLLAMSAARAARLVCHDRAAGRAGGLCAGCQPVCLTCTAASSTAEFLDWGWRYPSSWPLPSTWWRCLPACARWWASHAELLQQRELQPVSVEPGGVMKAAMC